MPSQGKDSTSPPSRQSKGQSRPSLERPTGPQHPQHLPQMSLIASSHSAQLPPFDRHADKGFHLPPIKQTQAFFERSRQPESRSEEARRKRKAQDIETSSQQSAPLPPIQQPPQGFPIYLPPFSPSPQPLAPQERHSRAVLAPRSPLDSASGMPYLHPSQSPYQPSSSNFSPSPRIPQAGPDSKHSQQTHSQHTTSRHAQSTPGVSQPALSHQDRSHSSAGTTSRFTSGSGSPSRSFSPYSQADQTSPQPQQHPSTFPAPSVGMERMSLNRSPSMGMRLSPDQRHSATFQGSIPVTTSSGQNTYQMMTIQTSTGPVQVPVDVQAASRVADEKRKRNAGASARFRERRKKKEIEASTTIRKLEHQVKNLSEDVEFYQRERDYFKDVILRTPGTDRHFPRPDSPRLRRLPMQHSGAISTDSDYDFVQEQPEARDDGRNVRRRTLSFPGGSDHSHPGPPPGPHALSASQPMRGMQADPRHPPPGAYNRPEEYVNLAPRSTERRDHSGPMSQLPPLNTLPPPVMQASPTTGPHNPYAGHRFDRAWPQGPPGPPQPPPRELR